MFNNIVLIFCQIYVKPFYFFRAPCIIFIDDIDYLCESRDSGGKTGVVTTLLHLLDGVDATLNLGKSTRITFFRDYNILKMFYINY